MTPSSDIPPEIFAALCAYTPGERATMLHLRAAIFEEAAAPEIEDVEESLKWGQPSYAPPRKAGAPSGSASPRAARRRFWSSAQRS